MNIFFHFLHTHFRKLVVAALLTAMGGALYGLGTTLTAQTYYPLLQKGMVANQHSTQVSPSTKTKGDTERVLRVVKSEDKWYVQDTIDGTVKRISPINASETQFAFMTPKDLAKEGELLAVCLEMGGGCWNESTGGWQTPPSGWQPQSSWDSGAVQMHTDNSGNNVVTVVNTDVATANMKTALGQHGGNTNVSLDKNGAIVAITPVSPSNPATTPATTSAPVGPPGVSPIPTPPASAIGTCNDTNGCWTNVGGIIYVRFPWMGENAQPMIWSDKDNGWLKGDTKYPNQAPPTLDGSSGRLASNAYACAYTTAGCVPGTNVQRFISQEDLDKLYAESARRTANQVCTGADGKVDDGCSNALYAKLMECRRTGIVCDTKVSNVQLSETQKKALDKAANEIRKSCTGDHNYMECVREVLSRYNVDLNFDLKNLQQLIVLMIAVNDSQKYYDASLFHKLIYALNGGVVKPESLDSINKWIATTYTPEIIQRMCEGADSSTCAEVLKLNIAAVLASGDKAALEKIQATLTDLAAKWKDMDCKGEPLCSAAKFAAISAMETLRLYANLKTNTPIAPLFTVPTVGTGPLTPEIVARLFPNNSSGRPDFYNPDGTMKPIADIAGQIAREAATAGPNGSPLSIEQFLSKSWGITDPTIVQSVRSEARKVWERNCAGKTNCMPVNTLDTWSSTGKVVTIKGPAGNDVAILTQTTSYVNGVLIVSYVVTRPDGTAYNYRELVDLMNLINQPGNGINLCQSSMSWCAGQQIFKFNSSNVICDPVCRIEIKVPMPTGAPGTINAGQPCGSAQVDLAGSFSNVDTGLSCGSAPQRTSLPPPGVTISPNNPNNPNPTTSATCNQSCTSHSQCGTGLLCIESVACLRANPATCQVASDKRCRMSAYPDSTTCLAYTPTPTLTGTLTPTVSPSITVSPTPAPAIDVTKRIAQVRKEGESYIVSVAISVKNTGNTNLTNIQLVDVLPKSGPTFIKAELMPGSLHALTSDLTVNPLYDGSSIVTLLTNPSKLAAGNSSGVMFAVKYTPATAELSCGEPIDMNNKVAVTAQSDIGTPSRPGDSDDDTFTIPLVKCTNMINLSLTKIADKSTYISGDMATFTITVKNVGTVLATNVALRDYTNSIKAYFTPEGFSTTLLACPVGSPQPSKETPVCVGSGGNVNYYVGDLPAGESKSFTLKGKTIQSGMFTNSAEVLRAKETDINSTPGNCMSGSPLKATLLEDDCASVTLTGKDPSPTPTVPGNPFKLSKRLVSVAAQPDGSQFLSYLVTVRNLKSTDVSVTSLVDKIEQNDAAYSYALIPNSMLAIGPAGVLVPNKNFNGKDNIDLLTLPEPMILAATGTDKSYATVAFTIRVVPKSAVGARLCNESKVTGSIDATKFEAESNITGVHCPLIQPPLFDIKKSAAPQTIKAGDSTIYTITLTNSGSGTMSNIQIEDTLDSGMRYANLVSITTDKDAVVSESNQTISQDKTKITFSSFTLPEKSSVVIKFSATAIGTCDKLYQNNVRAVRVVGDAKFALAEYSQTTAEDVTVSCVSTTSTPTPTPAQASMIDVALTKSADKRNVKLGDVVTFVVSVHNEGSKTALGLKVKDVLPASLQYMGHETSYGVFDNLTGIWNIGNLNVNQTHTLRLVARVAGRDNLKNFAEVYAHEQTDVDSTPNNGRNGEDDNAQVELILDEVLLAGSTKGGVLADTGYGVMVPLIAGLLFFVSLIALAEAHPNHKLVIKIVHPSHGMSFPKLRFMIMGTVVASGIAFAVSGLTFTQAVLQARVKLQQQYEYLQDLRLVDASVAVDKKNTDLLCNSIVEPEYTVTEKSPISFLITNKTDATAAFAIPGIDTLVGIGAKQQKTIPLGTETLKIPSAGTWYIINPVYCPGSTTLGVSKVTVEKGVVATPTPTLVTIISPTGTTSVTPTPTPPPGCKYEKAVCAQYVDPSTGVTPPCEDVLICVTPTLTPTHTPTPTVTPSKAPTNTPTKTPTPTPMLGCAASSIICGTKTTQNCYFVCGSCTNPSDQRCNACKRCDVATTNIYCSAPASAHGTSITVSGSGCTTTASCSNAVWSVQNKCAL